MGLKRQSRMSQKRQRLSHFLVFVLNFDTNASLPRNRGEERMNAFECMRRVYQSDGLRGFYRGMSASYAGISETVIHFVIYESIKRRLLEAKAPQNVNEEEEVSKDAADFAGMMLAAATSKTCATSIAYPHGKVFVFFLSFCFAAKDKKKMADSLTFYF